MPSLADALSHTSEAELGGIEAHEDQDDRVVGLREALHESLESLARQSCLCEETGLALDSVADPLEEEASGLEPDLLQRGRSEFAGNLVGTDVLHGMGQEVLAREGGLLGDIWPSDDYGCWMCRSYLPDSASSATSPWSETHWQMVKPLQVTPFGRWAGDLAGPPGRMRPAWPTPPGW